MNETILSAALSANACIYNRKIFELADHYGSLHSLYDKWQAGDHDLPKVVTEICRQSWLNERLEKIAALLKLHQITALLWTDQEYPEALRPLEDRPYVLFAQGDLGCLDNLSISCVGTRTMSPYGKRACEMVVGALRGQEVTVISGLALGIDGQTHRTALAHGLATVAVLAGGLDRHEPTSHAALADQILAQGGCLISEYPPGVRPQKHYFLERNRIIAGLALLTVVIEGRHKSGSLVTAGCAVNYGREVAVVPGDIFAPGSKGPLRLLREGAWPITSPDDLLDYLGIAPIAVKQIANRGPVFDLLKNGAASIDEITARLGLPLADIQFQLTNLELDGLIASSSIGEYYVK